MKRKLLLPIIAALLFFIPYSISARKAPSVDGGGGGSGNGTIQTITAGTGISVQNPSGPNTTISATGSQGAGTLRLYINNNQDTGVTASTLTVIDGNGLSLRVGTASGTLSIPATAQMTINQLTVTSASAADFTSSGPIKAALLQGTSLQIYGTTVIVNNARWTFPPSLCSAGQVWKWNSDGVGYCANDSGGAGGTTYLSTWTLTLSDYGSVTSTYTGPTQHIGFWNVGRETVTVTNVQAFVQTTSTMAVTFGLLKSTETGSTNINYYVVDNTSWTIQSNLKNSYWHAPNVTSTFYPDDKLIAVVSQAISSGTAPGGAYGLTIEGWTWPQP